MRNKAAVVYCFPWVGPARIMLNKGMRPAMIYNRQHQFFYYRRLMLYLGNFLFKCSTERQYQEINCILWYPIQKSLNIVDLSNYLKLANKSATAFITLGFVALYPKMDITEWPIDKFSLIKDINTSSPELLQLWLAVDTRLG